MAFPAQKYGAENFFFAAYYVHQEEMSCWLIIHICDLSLTLVISSLPEGHKKGFSVVFLPLPPQLQCFQPILVCKSRKKDPATTHVAKQGENTNLFIVYHASDFNYNINDTRAQQGLEYKCYTHKQFHEKMQYDKKSSLTSE